MAAPQSLTATSPLITDVEPHDPERPIWSYFSSSLNKLSPESEEAGRLEEGQGSVDITTLKQMATLRFLCGIETLKKPISALNHKEKEHLTRLSKIPGLSPTTQDMINQINIEAPHDNSSDCCTSSECGDVLGSCAETFSPVNPYHIFSRRSHRWNAGYAAAEGNQGIQWFQINNTSFMEGYRARQQAEAAANITQACANLLTGCCTSSDCHKCCDTAAEETKGMLDEGVEAIGAVMSVVSTAVIATFKLMEAAVHSLGVDRETCERGRHAVFVGLFGLLSVRVGTSALRDMTRVFRGQNRQEHIALLLKTSLPLVCAHYAAEANPDFPHIIWFTGLAAADLVRNYAINTKFWRCEAGEWPFGNRRQQDEKRDMLQLGTKDPEHVGLKSEDARNFVKEDPGKNIEDWIAFHTELTTTNIERVDNYSKARRGTCCGLKLYQLFRTDVLARGISAASNCFGFGSRSAEMWKNADTAKGKARHLQGQGPASKTHICQF